MMQYDTWGIEIARSCCGEGKRWRVCSGFFGAREWYCIAARDVGERDRGTSQASALVIIVITSALNVAPFGVRKRSRCRT